MPLPEWLIFALKANMSIIRLRSEKHHSRYPANGFHVSSRSHNDTVLIRSLAISDMVVSSEDEDRCLGMFQSYDMDYFFPVRSIVADRHMPWNQAGMMSAVSLTYLGFENSQKVWSILDRIKKPRLCDHFQGRLNRRVPVTKRFQGLGTCNSAGDILCIRLD